MFPCPMCGKPISPTATICPNCGQFDPHSIGTLGSGGFGGGSGGGGSNSISGSGLVELIILIIVGLLVFGSK